MLPIFNEYIKFLQDKGVDLELVEDYYWLDRQIIKAYDKQGTLQKIARLYIDDNLDITYKKYKNNYERRVLSYLSLLNPNPSIASLYSFNLFSILCPASSAIFTEL